MLAMSRFYARTGIAFLAFWRLRERPKKATMTENAIAKTASPVSSAAWKKNLSQSRKSRQENQ
jgi:hypothetical protein